MQKIDAFKFVSNLDSFQQPQAWIVRLPKGIATKNELLVLFYEKLKFPEQFGYNWDALFDCLRDLNWIDERLISIIHEDLPLIDVNELRKYLALLADAIMSWKPGDQHQLEVVFQESLREKVISFF